MWEQQKKSKKRPNGGAGNGDELAASDLSGMIPDISDTMEQIEHAERQPVETKRREPERRGCGCF